MDEILKLENETSLRWKQIADNYEEHLRYLVAEELRAVRSGIPMPYPWQRDRITIEQLCGNIRALGREIAKARDEAVRWWLDTQTLAFVVKPGHQHTI